MFEACYGCEEGWDGCGGSGGDFVIGGGGGVGGGGTDVSWVGVAEGDDVESK